MYSIRLAGTIISCHKFIRSRLVFFRMFCPNNFHLISFKKAKKNGNDFERTRMSLQMPLHIFGVFKHHKSIETNKLSHITGYGYTKITENINSNSFSTVLHILVTLAICQLLILFFFVLQENIEIPHFADEKVENPKGKIIIELCADVDKKEKKEEQNEKSFAICVDICTITNEKSCKMNKRITTERRIVPKTKRKQTFYGSFIVIAFFILFSAGPLNFQQQSDFCRHDKIVKDHDGTNEI